MSTETKAVHTPRERCKCEGIGCEVCAPGITSGPWTISQQQGLRLFIVAGDEAIAGILTGEKFNAEVFANARLMAAAPDMLEALRDLLRYVDASTLDGGWQTKNARAAIRKAEGQ